MGKELQQQLGLADFINTCINSQDDTTLFFDGFGRVPLTTITYVNLALLRRAREAGRPGVIISCPDFEREALAVAFLAAINNLEAADGKGLHEAQIGEKVAIGECVVNIADIDEEVVRINSKHGPTGYLKDIFQFPRVHTASKDAELSNTKNRYLQACSKDYEAMGGRLRKLLDGCGSNVPTVGYVSSPSPYLNCAPTKLLSGSVVIDGESHELSRVLPISYVSPNGKVKTQFAWPFEAPASILLAPRVDGVGSARQLLYVTPEGQNLDFVSLNIPSPEMLENAQISDIRDLMDAGVGVLGFCDRWTLDQLDLLIDLGFLFFDWDDCKEAELADRCVLSRIQQNRLEDRSEVIVAVDSAGSGLERAKQILYDRLGKTGMNDDEAVLAKQTLFRALGDAIRMTEVPDEELAHRQRDLVEMSFEAIEGSRSLSRDELQELREACSILCAIYSPGRALPKEDTIYRILSERLESSIPVALVVDKDWTSDALAYWTNELERNDVPTDGFKIVSTMDFMAEKKIAGDETVVFCGWYDRGTMDRAIHSGISSSVCLVLYSGEDDELELGWWNRAKGRWRRASAACADETNRTLEALGIEKIERAPKKWPAFHGREREGVTRDDVSPSTMVVGIERERIKRDLARSGEKAVFATPVVFDDGSHVWLRASERGAAGGKLIVITDCLTGASDEPVSKPVSALLTGDVVLITHSDKRFIRRASQVSSEDYQEIFDLAHAWSAPIERAKERGLTVSKITEMIMGQLKNRKSYPTVRGWVLGNRIAPRTKEDIRAIFYALKESVDDAEIERIASAAKRIRGLHQRSGVLAKQDMVRQFLEDVRRYGVEDALAGFDERHRNGSVELRKISSVGVQMRVSVERAQLA